MATAASAITAVAVAVTVVAAVTVAVVGYKLIFISGIFINPSFPGQSKNGRVNNNVPQNSNWFDRLLSEILYETVTLTTFDIVVFKYSLVRKRGR